MMPVRFVLGRAGSGKTHHCFEAAWAESREHGLGARVFMLLPPQGTFMAERRLAICAGSGFELAAVDRLEATL